MSVSKFIETGHVMTIYIQTCIQISIARMGLEKNLPSWQEKTTISQRR